MNTENLHRQFDQYIEKFDFVNSGKLRGEQNESYKWDIAANFKTLMDACLKAEEDEFYEKLVDVRRCTANLIENGWELPVSGMCDIAKKDPAAIKAVLVKLYADDNGDLIARQKKVDIFVGDCNNLVEKYFPSSFLYKMSFRAALALLALYAPEENYLYKAKQAKTFADCIKFYDDWGPDKDFKLPVYYRMCDQIVEEIGNYPALVEKHITRYETYPNLFADKNYHILAFDIIYCCTTYSLFTAAGLEFSPIKKEDIEKRNTALEKLKALDKAREEYNFMCSVEDTINEFSKPGTELISKAYGKGTVVAKEKEFVTIDFGGEVGIKKLGFLTAVSNGTLLADNERFTEILKTGKAYLSQSKRRYVMQTLTSAEKEIEKYADYLD